MAHCVDTPLMNSVRAVERTIADCRPFNAAIIHLMPLCTAFTHEDDTLDTVTLGALLQQYGEWLRHNDACPPAVSVNDDVVTLAQSTTMRAFMSSTSM